MFSNWSDLLDEINDLFKKITREKIFKKDTDNFLAHVQKSLKLNKKDDWNYILSSEDILEDTNQAIKNFLKFGLSGATKYDEIGEKYLRLYGLLNATYLQQQAILNLHKYFQCPNQELIKSQIESLQIRDLRHRLGAHSADYKDKNSDNVYTFVPVRMTLEDFKCSYFNNITNSYHDIELKQAIESHLKLLCNIYYGILIKSINTIYKNNHDKINTLNELAEPLKKMLDGQMIIKCGNNKFIFVEGISSKN